MLVNMYEVGIGFKMAHCIYSFTPITLHRGVKLKFLSDRYAFGFTHNGSILLLLRRAKNNGSNR